MEPGQTWQPVPPRAKTEAESKADTAFILGLIGIFVAQLILGILALVFASQAKDAARRNGEPVPPKARTATILGIVDLVVIPVVTVILAVIVFVIVRNAR